MFPNRHSLLSAIVLLTCHLAPTQAIPQETQFVPPAAPTSANELQRQRYPLFPNQSPTSRPVAQTATNNLAMPPRIDSPPIAQEEGPKARNAAFSSPGQSPPTDSDNRQVGSTEFTLATQPQLGAHHIQHTIQKDDRATAIPPTLSDFSPDPMPPSEWYSAEKQIDIYEGKKLNANQRPLLELGKPWYQLGELAPSVNFLGSHNPVSPQFIIYGDYRMAYASHRSAGGTTSQAAFELNLNLDLRLTGTERLTAFVAPLDTGAKNTRWQFDDDKFVFEFEPEVQFGMFEGDLGALVGGWTGQTLPFDLPFAVGVMPLLIQNGVWMDDAILGIAATLPARHNNRLGISNMDITFFAGYDDINSSAFQGDDAAAKMYGIFSFIEAYGGYLEIDYAYLEDRTLRDRSYHNIGVAFSRRFGRYVSNSVRLIVNAGQSTAGGPNTADGALLLIENSLITTRPSNFVPYLNFFAGFGRPQSAARAGNAGGVLRNTGILFETDGMTGFPTLDASGNDTTGAALGLNILTDGFTQQLVLEAAFLQTMGTDVNRNASDDQYGLGVRYQIPLSNSWILRTDGMYGSLAGQDDIHGLRMELRHKF